MLVARATPTTRATPRSTRAPRTAAATWPGSFLNFANVASSLTNDTVLGPAWACSTPGPTVARRGRWTCTRSRRRGRSTGDKSYPGPSIGPAIGSKSFATGWVPLGSTVVAVPGAVGRHPAERGGHQAGQRMDPRHDARRRAGARRVVSPTATAGRSSPRTTPPTATRSCRSPTPRTAPATSLASSQPVEQVSPTAERRRSRSRSPTPASTTWTPTNGYELSYEVYNAKGQQVAEHPVFTPMPLDRGARARR